MLGAEHGHEWFGTDISADMLNVARDEREVEGDLCHSDMGQGLPLRQALFDGAISISAVQWLCNADTAGAEPRVRLKRFFASLYAALTRGARAVLQFYPVGVSSFSAYLCCTATCPYLICTTAVMYCRSAWRLLPLTTHPMVVF
jgi:cyclopropane fatty-acyl-phospholipid synthase-like methyltransferase